MLSSCTAKRPSMSSCVPLLIITLFLHAADSTCPDSDWTAGSGGACYKVYVRPSVFNNTLDAQQFCQQQTNGSDLASITSASVNSVIIDLLANASIKTAARFSYSYIGLSDVAGGNFTWLDNNPVAFSNLSATEAGHHFIVPQEDKRCTAMYSSDGSWSPSTVSWTVVPCCFQRFNVTSVVCAQSSARSTQPNTTVLQQYCHGNCPPGWFKWKTDCFIVTRDVQSTTLGARKYCNSNVLKADLPTVADSGIDGFLGFVMDDAARQVSASNVFAYIGLNNINTASSFQQLNTNPLAYTNWATSEPIAGNNCTLMKWDGQKSSWLTSTCCSYTSEMWTACQKPEASDVTVSTNVFDQVCKVFCRSVTCQFGGTCNETLRKCICAPGYKGFNCSEFITCNPTTLDHDIRNATLNSTRLTSAVYSDQVTYVCFEGQQFADMTTQKTYKCDGSQAGNWNDSLTVCSPSCPSRQEVPNAIVVGNTAIGSIVNYTCQTGYIMSDNSTMLSTTCLEDRSWSKTLSGLSCEILHCPKLPDYPFQTVDLPNNNTYNTTVTFWCDVGYVLFDNTTARTIKCQADGTWTADLPPCLPVKCPEIQLTTNVERNTSDNTYLTYAKYSCKGNTRMKDGSTYRTILCDAGAEWSDIITDCTADRCFPLPYVANATPDTTNAEFWTTTRLTCIPGHRFFKNFDTVELDSDTMTCQSNGWWSPILTACKPILCPEVPTAVNIIPSTDSRLYGTEVDYVCMKGHYIDASIKLNKTNTTCQADKTWTQPTIKDCWPIQCSNPPAFANGTAGITYGPDHIKGKYNYSMSFYYECPNGTKFYDGRTKKNVTCNEEGVWNDTDVSCLRDRCDPINITPHSIPSTTNTKWDTNVTYTCVTGYEWPIDGTPYVDEIRCDRGTWIGSVVQDCVIKTCEAPQHLANATVDTSATVYGYGTVVEYRCKPGFKYENGSSVKTATCNDNKEWEPNPEVEQCHITYCPELDDVENATRDSNETYYDVTVTYSCLPGYQFPDKAKRKEVRCSENDTWINYPLSPCEVVFCPPLPYWSDAEFNSTDNNFLSVITYWCNDGYVFKGYPADKAGNQTILSSTCLASKDWFPPITDCISVSAINAELKGKTFNSPQAVPIGTIACSILSIFLMAVVILDASKLIADFRLMRSNLRALFKLRSNKVAPE